MEKKNIVFTKDGMKVGVKEVKDEDYADKTQRCAAPPSHGGAICMLTWLPPTACW